ncbi:FAD-dependent oxidoreductase [Reichenbachiella versicolor]|uniref:FAD-dependent oxidoreductase n=1 Tax=Reichenbachiella versicolor TaxID=1821036 RepID=UPI001FEC9511|nr:FAD-dependent oxidoreductase [Reichenbachiella versicolor]
MKKVDDYKEMKRRDFFKKTGKGAVAATMIPMAGSAMDKQSLGDELGDRTSDQWKQVATGEMGTPIRKSNIDVDVAVIGGGLAGMCAAISSARGGAKTILVQDRPVLGGNSSSEIRVLVLGAMSMKKERVDRETGIIEEILLHNKFFNPQESWSVRDHVLYDFITAEPNLDVVLNTQAIEAKMDGEKIKTARCWQSTTETEIMINASLFIDCSGDGLLAATSGALYRTGREGKEEFGEKYAPDEPDGWQMGATILLASKDHGKPMPFEAPHFTIPFDVENAHPKRKLKHFQEGFWWAEVGSEKDIIGEFEENRKKLMGYAYGIWDYMKNSGECPETENYALDWVCSLPGRRESRRFIGDYILKEPDLLNYKHFDDAVAFGGWSLDEHNPGGIENITEPPSYFHQKFEKIYEIPFRSLYSRNVPNLFFAGRNISQTHIALSSSRVMGTCALMGQAVGTAAAMCVNKKVLPRTVTEKYMNELQEQLLRDDAHIPNRPANDEKDLAKKASAIFGNSTVSGDANLLIDGVSRDEIDKIHHWESDGLPAKLQLEWDKPISISKIEIKCDTNVNRNIMMRKDQQDNDKFSRYVPIELLKSMNAEVRVKGKWVQVGEIDKNKKRLIKFNFEQMKASAIRLNLKETYGHKNVKLFEVRCYKS